VTHHLTARCAAASEDDETDYFRLGLAESPDFTGWYLMLHGGSADPAITLPAEDYCLETESADFTVGGILSVELTGHTLHLQLTDRAAADLTLPEATIAITLDIDADSLHQVSDGLARVFAGTSSTRRPSHLHLPGTDPTAYGQHHRAARQPKSFRVDFEVIGWKGPLATVQPVGTTDTSRMPADDLCKQLDVAPENLVGTQFSCLLTPDNWGTTYSDHQLTAR
jgi:hypothetical protein